MSGATPLPADCIGFQIDRASGKRAVAYVTVVFASNCAEISGSIHRLVRQGRINNMYVFDSSVVFAYYETNARIKSIRCNNIREIGKGKVLNGTTVGCKQTGFCSCGRLELEVVDLIAATVDGAAKSNNLGIDNCAFAVDIVGKEVVLCIVFGDCKKILDGADRNTFVKERIQSDILGQGCIKEILLGVFFIKIPTDKVVTCKSGVGRSFRHFIKIVRCSGNGLVCAGNVCNCVRINYILRLNLGIGGNRGKVYVPRIESQAFVRDSGNSRSCYTLAVLYALATENFTVIVKEGNGIYRRCPFCLECNVGGNKGGGSKLCLVCTFSYIPAKKNVTRLNRGGQFNHAVGLNKCTALHRGKLAAVSIKCNCVKREFYSVTRSQHKQCSNSKDGK